MRESVMSQPFPKKQVGCRWSMAIMSLFFHSNARMTYPPPSTNKLPSLWCWRRLHVFMFFYSPYSPSPIKEQMVDLSKARIGGWGGGVMIWNGEEEREGLQLRDVPCIHLSRSLLFSVICWPPKWRVVNGCQVGAGWGEPETGDDRCAS